MAAVEQRSLHLGGVPLTLSPSGFLSAQAYTAPGFYEMEMAEVFPRSWCFVADVDQLQETGDYVASQVGYEPVVVVMAKDGRIHAFSNVCPHRAALVCEGSGNCGAHMTCPYHGWSFNLDGTLANVTHRQSFDTAVVDDELGLPELRVGVWERFVFVNISGDAPPLLQWLGDAPEYFQHHQLSGGVCTSRRPKEFPFNWKIFVDNGFDGYHTPFVHPQTAEKRINTSRVDMWRGTSSTTSKGYYAWRDEYLGRLTTILPGIEGRWRTGSKVMGIHPNLVLTAFPDGSSQLACTTPLTVGTSLVQINNYSPHPVEAHATPTAPDGRTLYEEDIDICLSVNTGMKSRLYRPGPQHRFELQAQHFQRWLIALMTEIAVETGAAD